jgi:hypothetical protein
MKVIQGSEYKVYFSKYLESYISMFICEDGEFSGKLIGTLIRGSEYLGNSLTFTIVPISYKLYGSNRYRKARFYPHYPDEENSTWYIDEGKFY